MQSSSTQRRQQRSRHFDIGATRTRRVDVQNRSTKLARCREVQHHRHQRHQERGLQGGLCSSHGQPLQRQFIRTTELYVRDASSAYGSATGSFGERKYACACGSTPPAWPPQHHRRTGMRCATEPEVAAALWRALPTTSRRTPSRPRRGRSPSQPVRNVVVKEARAQHSSRRDTAAWSWGRDISPTCAHGGGFRMHPSPALRQRLRSTRA